jgi:L-fuculose-phosphate aldolase
MEWEMERRSVLAAALRLLERGLTVGTSGNVSQRVGDELVAITPSRRYYEDLTPEDIVVVDFEGEPVAGEGIPSVELMLHVGVYQARNDVTAVIHCHPPYASAAAVIGRPIPPILEDQMVFLGGQIEVAPHAISGSNELISYGVAALGDRNACLLANHGALVVGRDLRAATYACDYLEKLAMAYLFAAAAGQLNVLPPDVVETERAFFKMARI